MPVCIEDECNSELPPASLLFRAARQYAYGVLFSLAETHRRLERLALRKRAPFEGRATRNQLFGPILDSFSTQMAVESKILSLPTN